MFKLRDGREIDETLIKRVTTGVATICKGYPDESVNHYVAVSLGAKVYVVNGFSRSEDATEYQREVLDFVSASSND